ncbi:MAG: hypothetical protein Q7R62_00035 [bacterium]|nr:hypothetical protein [bacterium]
MSGHKESFYSTLRLPEEKAIFWIFIILVLLFFIWQVLAVGAGLGLFKYTLFSPRFFNVLWVAIATAWTSRLGPVFITLNIILFGIFIVATIKYRSIKSRVRVSDIRPPVRTRKVRFAKDPAISQHWGAILNRVKSGTQDAMKYSILDADTLVDHFLKSVGFSGEHMADRLTQIIPDNIPSLERVWKAHRLRNELAHTPGATVTVNETKEALTAYRDFLIELGAL